MPSYLTGQILVLMGSFGVKPEIVLIDGVKPLHDLGLPNFNGYEGLGSVA